MEKIYLQVDNILPITNNRFMHEEEDVESYFGSKGSQFISSKVTKFNGIQLTKR